MNPQRRTGKGRRSLAVVSVAPGAAASWQAASNKSRVETLKRQIPGGNSCRFESYRAQMLDERQRKYLDANPAAARIWAAMVRRDGVPASRAALCRWLRIPDRRLRQIISDLNVLSFPIVPDEGGGYKLGNKAECDAAALTLRSYSAKIDKRVRGLEHCYEAEPEPLPEPQGVLF